MLQLHFGHRKDHYIAEMSCFFILFLLCFAAIEEAHIHKRIKHIQNTMDGMPPACNNFDILSTSSVS